MKWIKSFPTTSALTAFLDTAENGYYLLRDESDTASTRIHYERVNNLPYFGVKALSASTVSFSNTSRNLQYSVDEGATWTNFTGQTINLSTDEICHWKRTTSEVVNGNFGHFTFTGGVSLQGNIHTLLSSDYENLTSLNGWTDGYGQTAFRGMFSGNTALYSIAKLTLPATSGPVGIYNGMFNGCSNLSGKAPVLPMTHLNGSAYYEMFNGTGINEIVTYVQTVSSDLQFYSWINQWARGTLYNLGGYEFTRDSYGVPSTWTIKTSLDE